MLIEFQRIKVGGCTSLIKQVLTSPRPGNFPNHRWSAYYINTPFCEINTNLNQWLKAVSARSTKKSEKERV